jgi:hypothetical protein
VRLPTTKAAAVWNRHIAGAVVHRKGYGKGLFATDEVVIEASGNCTVVSRLLSPFVARVVIAHPLQVKAIAHPRKIQNKDEKL